MLGQEAVLEIGRIVYPRRQQHYGRLLGCARWRNGFQSLEQFARIDVHRSDPQAFEQPRERPLHQVAVLQNVGDAGRHPQIVLEHVDLPVAMAHQIGPGDVAPDASRRINAAALRAIRRGGADHLFGDDFVLENLLVVIDIVDELVQRVDALAEPAFDPVPLLGANDARDQVEWKDALRAGGVAVDVERDPHLQQQTLGRTLAAEKLPFFKRLNRFQEKTGLRPGTSPAFEHLVVKTFRLVAV